MDIAIGRPSRRERGGSGYRKRPLGCCKAGPEQNSSNDHLVATGEHLDAIVIQAARLAAILLRIAQDIRHADKGQHVFEIRNT